MPYGGCKYNSVLKLTLKVPKLAVSVGMNLYVGVSLSVPGLAGLCASVRGE